MTNREVCELLVKIDHGYMPTEIENQMLDDVREITWEYADRLPASMSLLSNITTLSLKYNYVSELSVLSRLRGLTHLDLGNTYVSDVRTISCMTSLTNLNLSETRVRDISALSELTSLIHLDLSHTNVNDISALFKLTSLTHLDLSYTNVNDIKALSCMTSLTYLNLSFTSVSDISALSRLTSLTHLGLSGLKLNIIPEFLLDLRLPFRDWIRGVLRSPGIYIKDLELYEQPIEIFGQDRELIRAYYRSQDKVPINECKVIFLGDAEAGKTHSIKRLLKKGEKLTNFDGNSTPGIEITSNLTTIERSDIVVNYWDFGGQEIQHSMHRMFLTERTVYVVFLNARQDPLDDRARYWIENINSFASGAPILLIINKIDQNDRPKFNEEGIRAVYKDQIKDVVRMSALNDEPENFLEELQGSINRIIKILPTASTMVPKAWKSLMENIRKMPEYYLTTEEFKERCIAFNVSDYNNIHDNLVDLFQVIGVSFCYYKNRAIADYMLLNPKWLVNAIYTVVTNSDLVARNGIITQDDLYNLLKENTLYDKPIKRVIPDLRYGGIEVNYILEVIRMFRLSYPLKDGSEFFPMLCDGNEKISVNEAVSKNAIHYIFRYTYLPANVMHRLIVDMQADIDYRYVWYSGAFFINNAQNQVAYVHFTGNDLHLYVESRESFYNPNEYLSQLQKNVREINADLGLSAKEYVTYFEGDQEIEIPFNKLKGKLARGLFLDYDEILDRVIDYRVVAHRYENRFPKIKCEVLQKIIEALGAMQNERIYYKNASNSHELENSRNRFVAHQLRSAGYSCSDQQTGGESPNRRAAGERDILIRDENNQDILIYEGLNLEYVDKNDIGEHLTKLLENYNPQGLPYGVLTTYLSCEKKKFRGFIERYTDYLKHYAPTSFECLGEPIELRMTEGQFLSCIEMSYGCGNAFFVIYHIVVRIGP